MSAITTLRTGLAPALYGAWAWVSFSAITLLTVALLALTPGETARRKVAQIGATLALGALGTRVRVSGREHLPAGSCIVVANHASYLDGVLLTAVLPPRFSFVIKREMTRVPLANFLLRRIGSQFVERFDARRGASDARRILNHARRQQSLVFFPEGTFTPEPGLRNFHNGAFAAAVRARLPLVPVAVRGSRAMLPAERWLPRRGQIEVDIMPAIDTERSGVSVPGLIEASRRAILTVLDEPDLTD